MNVRSDGMTGQVRWAILLLASAVILPTVCLLWFMGQAMKNERLAVRARLEAAYRQQCRQAEEIHLDSDRFTRQLAEGRLPIDGLLAYDGNGALVFPVADTGEPQATDPAFEAAHRLEHVEKDYVKALAAYRTIGGPRTEVRPHMEAAIGEARCLYKLGRLGEAQGALMHAIHDLGPQEDMDLRSEQCRARLMHLRISRERGGEEFTEQLEAAFEFAARGMMQDDSLRFVGQPGFTISAVPSPLHAFFLTEYIEAAETREPTPELDSKIERARRILSFLHLSMAAAELLPAPAAIKWEAPDRSRVFRLDTKEPLYGQYHRLLGQTQLMIFTRPSMQAMLKPYVEAVEALPAVCRIYDERKGLIVGPDESSGQAPFLTVPLQSGWLGPDWVTEVVVEDDTFEQAAKRQAAIYVWSGALVAAMVLASGGLLTGTMVRQQRMTRLKNDFIATVTHELKTPLSSMRLLVDTLREGRVRDAQTTAEYLELIARENKRLTHLIDSFLTFSRMERGKRVFDFGPVDPGEVAAAAAEAMEARLGRDRCDFTCDVEDHLPSVRADRDALVTVLVNLLENACKYTGEDKRIVLRAFRRNGRVCFAVCDNGIGISPRAQRKIFQRFYQADSRLSRSAEGCGLGLSIVKYIVNAHGGTIDVDSRPGRGSTFTVRLPAIQKS